MNCDRCKLRFKCFTTNTSNRPTLLQGINFEVAKCCIRCKNGKFKRGKEPNGSTPTLTPSCYLRVGECDKHGVAVHQFSVCQDFNAKLYDNLSFDVHHQIENELNFKTRNYKFPRYCLKETKDVYHL